MAQKILIGSRGSKLALWQANFTKSTLEQAGFEVEIIVIKTKGDRIQHLSFDKLEGKGFFTKELEDALLDKSIDLAVHSCKDMPSEDIEKLSIVGYSKPANPADLLIIKPSANDDKKLWGIKEGAVIGTSSARRKSQVLSYRPDLICEDIRGNVPTRLDKLREGQFDAIVLAAAGVERLLIDLSEFIVHEFNPKVLIPAPAQGVLAFQIREDDEALRDIVLTHLNDATTAKVVQQERSIMAAIGGGCQTPLGIYIERVPDPETIHLAYGIENKNCSRRLLFYPKKEELSEFIATIKLENTSPKTIFMGTEVDDNSYFVRMLKSMNHTVKSQSLIDFKAVKIEQNFDDVDWLFFASKNGVRYFFEQVNKERIAGIKIGAVSQGTALVLKEHGVSVDYTGTAANMEDVGTDFKSLHKGFVVFVRANQSRRSLQRVFNEGEYRDLIAYTNVMKENVNAVEADVYVFTSSLGFKAYVNENKIDRNKHIIAIGDATGNTIRSFGYTCAEAHQPSISSLVEEVFSMDFRKKKS